MEEVGLVHARDGAVARLYVANVPGTAQNDVNSMVLVDGPYPSAAKAASSAQSLLGVEYASSGGRWEVSATLISHLNSLVGKVAKCLGGATPPKKYTF
jgi:hypothetical protein